MIIDSINKTFKNRRAHVSVAALIEVHNTITQCTPAVAATHSDNESNIKANEESVGQTNTVYEIFFVVQSIDIF